MHIFLTAACLSLFFVRNTQGAATHFWKGDDFARMDSLEIHRSTQKVVKDGSKSRKSTPYYPEDTTWHIMDSEASTEDLEDYDSCDSEIMDNLDTPGLVPIEELPPPGTAPILVLRKNRPSTPFIAFLQAFLILKFPPFVFFIATEEVYENFKFKIIENFFLDTEWGNNLKVRKSLEKLLDMMRMVCIQFEYSYLVSEEESGMKLIDKKGAEALCKLCNVSRDSFIPSKEFFEPHGMDMTFKRFIKASKLNVNDPTGGAVRFFRMLLNYEKNMSFNVELRTIKDVLIDSSAITNEPVITIPVQKKLEIASSLDALVMGTFRTKVHIKTFDDFVNVKCDRFIRLLSFPKLQLFHLQRTDRHASRKRVDHTARLNTVSHRPVDIPLQLKYPYNSVLRAAIIYDTRPRITPVPIYAPKYSVILQEYDEEGNFFTLYDAVDGTSFQIEEEEAIQRISRMAKFLIYQREDDPYKVIKEYRYSAYRPALNYPTVITPLPTKKSDCIPIAVKYKKSSPESDDSWSQCSWSASGSPYSSNHLSPHGIRSFTGSSPTSQFSTTSSNGNRIITFSSPPMDDSYELLESGEDYEPPKRVLPDFMMLSKKTNNSAGIQKECTLQSKSSRKSKK